MRHIQTLQELIEEHWYEADPDAQIPDNLPFLMFLSRENIYYYHAGQDTFYRDPGIDMKRYTPIPLNTRKVPTILGLYRTSDNILWELFLDDEAHPTWRSMETGAQYAPAYMYPHLPLTRVRIVDIEESQ